MSTPAGYVDAPVYLQVEPRHRGGWRGDVYDSELTKEAAVVAHTLTRPQKPRSGVVVVKVTLRIPAGAFDPLRPEAVVVIPTDMTDPHPVEVEASDPIDGGPS